MRPGEATAEELPGGGRFVALDALRGIAALGVAAYHLRGGGPLFESAFVRSCWLWVDFFFVLSGFVIAASYGDRLAQGFSLRRFIFLRLGRVYPLHLVLLLGYLAFEIVVLALQAGSTIMREPFGGPRSVPLLIATLFLVQVFIPRLDGWNAQSWSISAELWLYVGFALLWRMAGRHGWLAGLVLALAAGLVVLAVQGNDSAWLSTRVLRGIAGFGTGAALWHWHRRSAGVGGTLPEAACLAAIFAIFCVDLPTGTQIVLADLAFAATVLVFAREGGAVSRLLLRKPFVFVGTVSYSIYMVHLLVLARGIDVLSRFGLGGYLIVHDIPFRRIVATPLLADAIGIALIAASVPVAWLTWRFIESPARAWSRRRAARMGIAAEERVAPTF